MGKPRIILADQDENYIIPLEMKFLEELNDEADLEVITDPEYFSALFSKPQEADILAVSADFYNPSLSRHNIKNLFLLAELPEDEQSRRLDIPYIYKYSSLKEIYGKIMAVSNESLNVKLGRKGGCQVVMFYSAVGGVGKTLLSLGICTCLAQNFRRVLYVNADHMNTFQFYLPKIRAFPSSAIMGITEHSSNLFSDLSPYILHEKFDLLPPFGAALSSLGLDYRFYGQFIDSAKNSGNYDLIILDADVILDRDKISLASGADKVFLVTDQRRRSVLATNFLMQNLNCRDNEKFYFICNDCGPEAVMAEENPEAEFIVDEYVRHIPSIEEQSLSDLGMNLDIQRLSFLIE